MSAPQFTPGPWAVGEGLQASRRVMMPDDCIEIRRGDRGMVACLYATNASMDGSEDRANARLIAAAPELYEALAELLGSCSHTPVGAGDGDTYVVTPPTPEASRKAIAALAKARGQ